MTLFPCNALQAIACLVLAAGQAATAQAPVTAASPDTGEAKTRMAIQTVKPKDTLHILVGQSTILRGVSPMRRVFVGNPAVLQTVTTGPEEIVVTAKAPGVSSLVLWDTADGSCLYTVYVDIDSAGLRQSLDAAFPNNVVEVAGAQDRLTLSGVVASPEISDGMVKMATVYSKDVVNSLRVVTVHGKQVQLKLRIAEADRTKLEQFGVNLFKAISGGALGNNVGGTTTGQFASSLTATTATATAPATVVANNPLSLFLYNFSQNIGTTVQDLESKQVLQILAEPTLTTLSGLPARFLSGGEFPFPVAQAGVGGTSAISIQFRPYGVRVDFTPTVNEDGSIRLKIAPEVSALDYANAVTISGFTVPALSTRRAESEVELKDGQSFMLSGLLDRRVTDNLSKMPGFASIPILGQLFRSKNNNHSVTDLIIMVTVTIVDPLHEPAQTADPKWVVPNLDTDKFDKQFNKEVKTPGIP